MSSRFIIFLAGLLIGITTVAQEEKKKFIEFHGYVKDMQVFAFSGGFDSASWVNLIHNRMNIKANFSERLTARLELRNRIFYGSQVRDNPEFGETINAYPGNVDLSKLWVDTGSLVIQSVIDRLLLKYNGNKWDLTVGRQRINWGINLVWTPNDIFNAFNYFDFDYVERPGCDAVLMQYYTSNTSSLQLGFKADQHLYILDSAYKYTYALMYRFNRWGYDFQVLGGVMREDAVVGAGWSGSIKGAGFNGEASYFLDKGELFDTTGALVASAELNYTLKNSLFLHAGYLYNSAGTTGPAGWGTALFLVVDISAKNFTRARHSLFAEASYPITPLIKGSLAGIFNPNDKSGFAGPSLDISLTDNLSLYMIGQIFWGDHLTEFGDYGTRVFWRLKWNF